MSLFTINRYLGENPKAASISAQSILDELNAKAKGREEKRLSGQSASITASPRECRQKPLKDNSASSSTPCGEKQAATKRRKKDGRSSSSGDCIKEVSLPLRKCEQDGLKEIQSGHGNHTHVKLPTADAAPSLAPSIKSEKQKAHKGRCSEDNGLTSSSVDGKKGKRKSIGEQSRTQPDTDDGVISVRQKIKKKRMRRSDGVGEQEAASPRTSKSRTPVQQENDDSNVKRKGKVTSKSTDISSEKSSDISSIRKKGKAQKQNTDVGLNEGVENEQKEGDRGKEKKTEEEDDDRMEIGLHEDELEEVDGSSKGENSALNFQVLGEFERRSKKKVQETLPEWLANPLVIEHNLADNSIKLDAIKGLDARLISTLNGVGIERFFPVQHHVIPLILDSMRYCMHAGCAGFRPRDLCVSAPTGSGKTLAYSVPIVQALIDRVVPSVRALVVLPTRDLAIQVHKVITRLCTNTSVKAMLLGGTKKFAHEQSQLVKGSDGEFHSCADIIVATPGRLVDHINQTQGFTLTHLRYLVIDEADRMMDQITHDWISQVERSAYASDTPSPGSGLIQPSNGSSRPRPGPLTVERISLFHPPLQKLLFSATLSQNPEKLIQLRLFQPRLITTVVGSKEHPLKAHGSSHRGNGNDAENETREGRAEAVTEFIGKYTTPVGLSEYFIQCSAGDKPLVLCHLLLHLYFKQILCFTNTVEATHRLYLLLRLVGGVEVAEFSSKLSQWERQAILKRFKAGKIQILVCSDAMARGMDIENVKCVVSYDLPPHLKTYIHRVGRTARAGRAGTAFSFIRKAETTKFRQMLRNSGKDNIQRHDVSASDLESLVPAYTDALSQLSLLLKEEKTHKY